MQTRKPRSHKEILKELTDWCEKVEEGEIMLSSSGYEAYGESWWDSDWVTEYEDPMEIGPQLKRYYKEAEQAVYDRDYESASQMYRKLGTLNITTYDEEGGDLTEMGIEDMVSEKLVSLNLKQIAALTLYSIYQAYELPERIRRLYSFFSRRMFKDTGMEALRRMNRNMEIRDKAARMTAAAATNMGESNIAAEALKEAFCSKPTAANYFRVLTCGGPECGRDDLKSLRELAERLQQEQDKRQKPADNGEGYTRYYWREPKETDPYRQTDQDRLGIYFLDGDCQMVWRECRKTKTALGWSGKFIEEGVPMLLALLCENSFESKAMRSVLSDIKQYIGYEEEYDEPEFIKRFLLWKKQVIIPGDEKKKLLSCLAKIIDERVTAIVGGSHRGSYYKAARLGAALGEVEESMGKDHGKAERMNKYLAEFPRHSAFKREMREYM